MMAPSMLYVHVSFGSPALTPWSVHAPTKGEKGWMPGKNTAGYLGRSRGGCLRMVDLGVPAGARPEPLSSL
jgi:hypothetical protein